MRGVAWPSVARWVNAMGHTESWGIAKRVMLRTSTERLNDSHPGRHRRLSNGTTQRPVRARGLELRLELLAQRLGAVVVEMADRTRRHHRRLKR